jgi:hypothetical protein
MLTPVAAPANLHNMQRHRHIRRRDIPENRPAVKLPSQTVIVQVVYRGPAV